DEFCRFDRVTVLNAGKYYRIPRRPHALIEVWDARTHRGEASLCVVFQDPGMPPSDEVVMKYLLAKPQPDLLSQPTAPFTPRTTPPPPGGPRPPPPPPAAASRAPPPVAGATTERRSGRSVVFPPIPPLRRPRSGRKEDCVDVDPPAPPRPRVEKSKRPADRQ